MTNKDIEKFRAKLKARYKNADELIARLDKKAKDNGLKKDIDYTTRKTI